MKEHNHTSALISNNRRPGKTAPQGACESDSPETVTPLTNTGPQRMSWRFRGRSSMGNLSTLQVDMYSLQAFASLVVPFLSKLLSLKQKSSNPAYNSCSRFA